MNNYRMVRDAKDVYIEVGDENEAELLECINRKEEELLLLKAKQSTILTPKTRKGN